MLTPAAFEPTGDALAPVRQRKRDSDRQTEAESGMFLPWEAPLPSLWEPTYIEAERQRGRAGERTAIEVSCPGALPGEERSVRLPDGRECLVRVPSDVTDGRFSVQWAPILPPAKKRHRHASDSRASAKDDKTWKAVHALIAARPSSALATSELLRLREPPRGARIFAPLLDHHHFSGVPDTLVSQWAPVSSTFLAGDKVDACGDDGAFDLSATTSTGVFGIPDFLLC